MQYVSHFFISLFDYTNITLTLTQPKRGPSISVIAFLPISYRYRFSTNIILSPQGLKFYISQVTDTDTWILISSPCVISLCMMYTYMF